EAGIVVISGMARGIDAAAHLGALDTGSIAVVAGGADIVYPEENRGLYDALSERGAVVAELPLGTERRRAISRAATGSSPAWRSGSSSSRRRRNPAR
ncbi:MAG TPA: DNA-processing protein DprA, partial [Stellaceae bacterium]|nr:DNA-processing protein DprA [Stellaceae bacterium]